MGDARDGARMRIVLSVAGCAEVGQRDLDLSEHATVGELRRAVRRELPLGIMFTMTRAGAPLPKDTTPLRDAGFADGDTVHVVADDDHASPITTSPAPAASTTPAAASPASETAPPPLGSPAVSEHRTPGTGCRRDLEVFANPTTQHSRPASPSLIASPPPVTSPPVAASLPSSARQPSDAAPRTSAPRASTSQSPAFPWDVAARPTYSTYEEQQRSEAEQIASLKWASTREELLELQQQRAREGYAGQGAFTSPAAAPPVRERSRDAEGPKAEKRDKGRTERARKIAVEDLVENTSDTNTLEVYDIAGRDITEDMILGHLGLFLGLNCKYVKWRGDHSAYIQFNENDTTTVDHVMRTLEPTENFKVRVWDPEQQQQAPPRRVRTERPRKNVAALASILKSAQSGNARQERLQKKREAAAAAAAATSPSGASPDAASTAPAPPTVEDNINGTP